MSSVGVAAGQRPRLNAAAVTAGASAPLGATVSADGVGFSVFAKDATRIDLLLFDDLNAADPARVIPLDAPRHRTYHYWHVFVPGLTAGQVYAYRAHGPFAPQRGLRFDAGKLLLDPYGLRGGGSRRIPAAMRPASLATTRPPR